MNVVVDTNVVISAIIVSKDRDLLVLQKPFGIEILTPRHLLARLP